VVTATQGDAKALDLHRLNLNVSQWFDNELPSCEVIVSGTGTTRIAQCQTYGRRRLNANNGRAAIAGSTNGWLVAVWFEGAGAVAFAQVADGVLVGQFGNVFILRTSKSGAVRLEVTCSSWANVKACSATFARCGDLLTMSNSDNFVVVPPASGGGPYGESVVVDFGAGSNHAEAIQVASWASSSLAYSCTVAGEDGLLDEVEATVTDIVEGVSFVVKAYAPNGSIGTKTIHVIGV
jgi:hypothetical protein